MTLSKIAGATSSASKVASPGISGLYGKKPEEKMRMPTGISRFAITVVQRRRPIVFRWSSKTHSIIAELPRWVEVEQGQNQPSTRLSTPPHFGDIDDIPQTPPGRPRVFHIRYGSLRTHYSLLRMHPTEVPGSLLLTLNSIQFCGISL